jgi:LDH2 family malate/lactate/ureidoglycolate dehydrogenase
MFEAAELRRLVDGAAAAAGMPAEHRELFADGLVEADLRGVASHGIARLPAYTRAFIGGVVAPAPEVSLIEQRGAISLLDGGNGIGVVVGQLAMRRAVEQARGHGIGAVAVRNSNHAGMLASHVLQASDAGMIGYFTSNGPAIMPPWGGRTPMLGNGPFAFAIPTDSEHPVVLDMACSAVARGKIRLAAAGGQEIPLGWALDVDGAPTSDAKAAMAGVVLPMAGYKGYALAFVNEILSAALPGAALASEMPRGFLEEGSTVLDRWSCGHFMIAIDVDCFGAGATVRALAGRIVDLMHAAPRSGDDEILVPGEPERRERERRARDGVPLAQTTVALLDGLAQELGITPLEDAAPDRGDTPHG